MKLILIVTVILGIPNLVFAIGDAELVMCTMDAKLCPDGSYVSRTGPNCEFTPCAKLMPEEFIDVTITGSAETPDPVLERVLELERKGIISNVIIMESFPVRIRMKATQKIIDELESMPRIKSPTFR